MKFQILVSKMIQDTGVKAILNMMVKHTTVVQKQVVTTQRGAMIHVDMVIGTTAQIAIQVSGYTLVIY